MGPYSAERNFDSALLKDAVPCVGPYCMLEWHDSSAQRVIPRAKIAFPCASRCAHGAPVSRLMRPGADVKSVLSHLATLRKGSAAPGGAKLPRGPSQPVGAMGRCCLAAMVLSRAACSRARRHGPCHHHDGCRRPKRWKGRRDKSAATASTRSRADRSLGEFSARKYVIGFGIHGKVILDEIASLWFRDPVIVFEALRKEGVSGLSG